jgi:hypothetical protein
MWPAEVRARTLKKVLYCYEDGCEGCAAFEARRAAFETRFKGGVAPWNCSEPEKRAFAVRMGVTRIPAYIVLEETAKVITP